MNKIKQLNYSIIKCQQGQKLIGRSWEYLKANDGNYYSRRIGTTRWIKNTEKTGLQAVKNLFLPKSQRTITTHKSSTTLRPSTTKPLPRITIAPTGVTTSNKVKTSNSTIVHPKTQKIQKKESPWYLTIVDNVIEPIADNVVEPIKNLFGFSNSFGGGRSGGGGAGSRIPENDNLQKEEEIRQHQIVVNNKETFNQAFARARKAGKKTFEFNGKLYTTELDTSSNKDHYSAGQKRTRGNASAVYIESKTDKNGNNNVTIKPGIATTPTSFTMLQYKDGGYLNLFD